MTPNRDFVDRALGWLDDLDLFDPARAEADPRQESAIPVVELALLCMCLRREPSYRRDARVARFLEFVGDAVSRPMFLLRIARVKELVFAHAVLLGALRECGAPQAAGERAIGNLAVNSASPSSVSEAFGPR